MLGQVLAEKDQLVYFLVTNPLYKVLLECVYNTGNVMMEQVGLEETPLLF